MDSKALKVRNGQWAYLGLNGRCFRAFLPRKVLSRSVSFPRTALLFQKQIQHRIKTSTKNLSTSEAERACSSSEFGSSLCDSLERVNSGKNNGDASTRWTAIFSFCWRPPYLQALFKLSFPGVRGVERTSYRVLHNINSAHGPSAIPRREIHDS